MNTLSLSFYSKALECEYKAYNTKTQGGVFGRNIWFYGLIAFAMGVHFFILGEWQIGIIAWCYALIIAPIIYAVATKIPLYFDFVCFNFQLAVIVSAPFAFFLKIFFDSLNNIDLMLFGQNIVFIVQGFNLGSRFDMKFVVILINIISQSSLYVLSNQTISSVTIFWIGSNLIILNYVYWQDRNQREAFLIKYNEKMWQQEIGSFAQLCIITCVSDKGLLKPDLYESNQQSKQEFSINDQESFKLFLNSVTLVPKNKSVLKIINEMRSCRQFKSNQKLHTQIYKLSEQGQVQNQEFFGIYNLTLYEVKIFTTWNNQLMNIHTLLTKSTTFIDSVEILKHRYEHKLFTNYRYQIGNSIKGIFVRLKQLGLMNRLQRENGSLMSDVYNALRLNYNIQLFLNPEYVETRTKFFLWPIINEINGVTTHSMPKPYQLKLKCLVDYNLIVYSCQKTIFQILFNLFQIIVRPAKQSGYIQVTVKQKLNVLHRPYINFEIRTNVSSIQNILSNQNHQKNVYGQNFGSYIHNQNVGLEMAVSEYLIGRIGPKRCIKLANSSEEDQFVSFNIYQDLNHLIQ